MLGEAYFHVFFVFKINDNDKPLQIKVYGENSQTPVEIFFGIPYAAPPIGRLRFSVSTLSHYKFFSSLKDFKPENLRTSRNITVARTETLAAGIFSSLKGTG